MTKNEDNLEEELKAFDEEIEQLGEFEEELEDTFDEELSDFFDESEVPSIKSDTGLKAAESVIIKSDKTPELSKNEAAPPKKTKNLDDLGSKKPQAQAVPNQDMESDLSAEEAEGVSGIPLNITVEIARLNMNLKSLLNLQAGNLLKLNVTAEQGVDLTINGNKVARGELLRIGETLGVRILEIKK